MERVGEEAAEGRRRRRRDQAEWEERGYRGSQRRNDVTREWLVTRHSRVQLQIAFARNGPATMFPVGRGRTKNVSPRRF